jgi:hypothetical protein
MLLKPDAGDGVFYRNSRVRIADITDGASTTLAVGERPALFAQAPWAGAITGGSCQTTPGAPVYVALREPPSVMVMARVGKRRLMDPHSEPYDFFSPHRDVIHFAFADGSARPLSTAVSLDVLAALATRSGGEVISASDY